ncbi:MAG: chemotaxis response regulator protein-glutamate methylesterase [Burkholderiales bacterium]|nr:chemotaxis response regulator protein-glutamate methylesterase [Burkholderiales bacterium]MDP2399227.1 chemotaxis response regulator protein-glutamate methylesterase [Burkholderiales bacterium]
MQKQTVAPPLPCGRIKVVIVDDSALIRSLLAGIINRQPDMMAVGAAPDPIAAREMIRTLNPDVLTLDVEMPRMDGIDFLEKLMRLRPMPVVMVSTMTQQGAEVTLRALELGAVDFVAKPKLDVSSGMEASAREIVEKVRLAATARVRKLSATSAVGKSAPVLALGARAGTEKLIIIGASTGGTEAIKEVLLPMPPDAPGIVITQHMPAGFTKSFAQRLDGLCRISVKEAVDGERILPGHAYIAPGDHHLLVRKSGANYVTALSNEAPVNRHRPSVEVLFKSVAQCVGANAIGIMLTGMGKDGAKAMLEMKRAGAFNIAQDEDSCVVFGMPKEAIAAGGVDEVLPLGKISRRVLDALRADGVRHRI